MVAHPAHPLAGEEQATAIDPRGRGRTPADYYELCTHRQYGAASPPSNEAPIRGKHHGTSGHHTLGGVRWAPHAFYPRNSLASSRLHCSTQGLRLQPINLSENSWRIPSIILPGSTANSALLYGALQPLLQHEGGRLAVARGPESSSYLVRNAGSVLLLRRHAACCIACCFVGHLSEEVLR